MPEESLGKEKGNSQMVSIFSTTAKDSRPSQVASELGIAEKTIKVHRARVMEKTESRRRDARSQRIPFRGYWTKVQYRIPCRCHSLYSHRGTLGNEGLCGETPYESSQAVRRSGGR
jgi:hypothetical protein